MNKRSLEIGIGLMLLLTFIVYLNHFNNTFHFDDFHTIVNNANIRSLKNVPRFFKDGATMSVLPQNQAYRPVTVTSIAFDYWLAGDYYASYFQTSTFIWFLLQGILMVFLFKNLFDKALQQNTNTYPALIAATWYMLHPANAETVNYIIARADVQSTMLVLLGLVLYIYSPFCRKTYLYLLAIGIGVLCKPPAVMFAPLLFFYLLYFDAELSLSGLFKRANVNQVWTVFLKTLPSFIFCGVMYVVVDKMTPKTWEPGGSSPLQYLITQPFVILHYFAQFILPTGLSADTDWRLLPSIWDIRFFAGCLFIVLMIVAAFYSAKNKATRPISFGIIWFFLTLLPTSSIIPLGEVLNDHRMYFPFVGLVISVTWSIVLVLQKYRNAVNKRAIVVASVVILALYAFGTYARNEVWHSEESLWHDVSIKSPNNARGLMNYGLALLARQDYDGAENYFNKAAKIAPEYSFLYTNIGLIKEKKGDLTLAENYYKAGIKLGEKYPDPYTYYAAFLIKQFRFSEAEPLLNQAIKISPLYIFPRTYLMQIYSTMGRWDELGKLATETLNISPDNPEILPYLQAAREKRDELDVEDEHIQKAPNAEKFMALSLKNYDAKRFKQCVATAAEAVKVNPKYAEAYNNMGAGYIRLKQYQDAVKVLKVALQLKPDFVLAKNNLLHAANSIAAPGKPDGLSAADYLELSLSYFNKGLFKQCIDACNNALAIDPNYYLAYNNICAANNQLAHWDEAIAAAKKGLQIKPDYQMLKNNLAVAEQGKAKGGKK
jgi:tetratricopeptide (TPR) repeat protein